MSISEITKLITSKDLSEKKQALYCLITNIIKDNQFDPQIMTILNYVVPYQKNDTDIRKLLLVYWETINKYNDNG